MAKEMGTILYSEWAPNICGPRAPQEIAFELYCWAFWPDHRRVPEIERRAVLLELMIDFIMM